MSTLKISDGVVKDEVLVLGLSSTNSKGGIAIESGEMAIDTKTVLAQLVDMGATGKTDEVIKVPGTHVRMFVFTGLGAKASQYSHEILRRAAGAPGGPVLGATGLVAEQRGPRLLRRRRRPRGRGRSRRLPG